MASFDDDVDVVDGVVEGGWVLDGYAGTGGFTRSILAAAARVGAALDVVGVEVTPSCAAPLAASGASVVARSMEDALASLEARAQSAPLQAMVLDPPRKGLREAATRLAALKAPTVVLVSCDPDAMARDLNVFLAAGYVLERITPVDLFPTSMAVEALSVLRRPWERPRVSSSSQQRED